MCNRGKASPFFPLSSSILLPGGSFLSFTETTLLKEVNKFSIKVAENYNWHADFIPLNNFVSNLLLPFLTTCLLWLFLPTFLKKVSSPLFNWILRCKTFTIFGTCYTFMLMIVMSSFLILASFPASQIERFNIKEASFYYSNSYHKTWSTFNTWHLVLRSSSI